VTGGATVAEGLIRRACRRLPAETRDERCREWTAEVGAILEDSGARPGMLGSARALGYALGIWKCTHDPVLNAGSQPGSARRAAVVRVTRGVGIYLAVVAVFFIAQGVVFQLQGPLPVIVLVVMAVCFDSFCLVDLARARQVRYLPKWLWALACLVQSPLGGIMYLSAGRVRS
jgi:hypothetical protein